MGQQLGRHSSPSERGSWGGCLRLHVSCLERFSARFPRWSSCIVRGTVMAGCAIFSRAKALGNERCARECVSPRPRRAPARPTEPRRHLHDLEASPSSRAARSWSSLVHQQAGNSDERETAETPCSAALCQLKENPHAGPRLSTKGRGSTRGLHRPLLDFTGPQLLLASGGRRGRRAVR